jgi:hypothetical protein
MHDRGKPVACEILASFGMSGTLTRPLHFCIAQTAIECTTNRGTPCSEILPIEPSCSSNGSITSVRFRLDFASCGDSYYNQAGFTCADLGPFPAAGQSARVDCSDSDANVMFSNLVREKGTFGFFAVTSSGLPAYISCSLTTNDGSDIQKVAFDLSGGDELYLQNTFGSLRLEACDELDCHLNVSYFYLVGNEGNVAEPQRTSSTAHPWPHSDRSWFNGRCERERNNKYLFQSGLLHDNQSRVGPSSGVRLYGFSKLPVRNFFDTIGTIPLQAPTTMPP